MSTHPSSAPQPPEPPQGSQSVGAVPPADAGAEWLRGEGDLSDVLLSSRVRFARNLAARPFATKATRHDRQATLDICRDCLMQVEVPQSRPQPADTQATPGEAAATSPARATPSKLIWVDLHEAFPLDRALLVERHLISKNHSKGKGTNPNDDPRGVAISVPDERISVMVNEEDHLRMQSIRSGLALTQAWQQLDALDDAIESRLAYAFSPRFGYLTACPTNVGTGVRMSVMLHLPALRLTGELEKVKRAAQDMSLAVRGFYGEGSEAIGDLFQISNQTTLGKSEQQILQDLEGDILPKVVEYERLARRELLAKRRVGLEDQVWRAWGALTHARLMNTDEAMQNLSLVRLGATMGLLRQRSVAMPEGKASGASHQVGPLAMPSGAHPASPLPDAAQPAPALQAAHAATISPSVRVINQLLLLVQPAHLQRAVGRELDQEQRRVARASLLRTRLSRV